MEIEWMIVIVMVTLVMAILFQRASRMSANPGQVS